jgi:hypothetical protein
MPKTRAGQFLFLLIFLHLAVALPLAFYLNIWVDEASTLRTTQNGIFRAFNNLFDEEKQAPLYFLLLSVWRKLSDSVFFARLFSIVCSIAAIKIFFDLVRRLWDDRLAFFVSAFFALHPVVVWASLEIRLYALAIFLSVALLRFFYEGYLEAESRPKTQIYFVLAALAALYTNYYLGFLLVGCFAALVALRRWAQAKSFFMQMLFVALAITPLLWIVREQFSVRVFHFQPDRWLGEGLSVFWNHFLTFILPTEIFPPDEVSAFSLARVWLIRFLILAALLLTIGRRGKNLDEKVFAFGAILLVTVAFLLFVYFQLGHGYIEIRHASVFFATFVLLAAAVANGFLPQRRDGAEGKKINYPLVLTGVLCAAFFAYSLATLYPNLAKRGDWARVAAYLEQNEKPGQPIILFQAYDAIALPFHYRGRNRVLPDEKFFAFDYEDKAGSAASFRDQIDFIIREIPPGADEIWLLTNEKCAVEDACLPLENYAAANYTVIEEKNFYKEKVRLLRRKGK